MRKSFGAIALILIGGHFAQPAAEPFAVTIEIDSGRLEGAVTNDVLSFKGIPYAKPPMGELRWQPPVFETWAGVRPAQRFGSDCLQMGFPNVLAHRGAEDCLFLNVWRPAQQGAPGERLPVLVWIHGGGNVIGGSSEPGLIPDGGALADGSAFARSGLVFVSLNYRLGRLGFFAHPALIAASGGSTGYSGNFGLMDQIRALEWVRDNIAKFGGDPGQVAVMGESAGGANVLHLLTSPRTRGLLHRAIVMSGAGRHAPLLRRMAGGTLDRPSADMIGAAFARPHGIEGAGAQALEALRGLNALKLVADLNFIALVLQVQSDDPHAGLIMIDGSIVPSEPAAIICRGEAARVPVMVGTVANELPISFPPRVEPYPYAYFGPWKDEAVQIYGRDAAHAKQQVGADMSMHEPARFIAKSFAAGGAAAWLYRFTYVSQAEPDQVRELGAAHASELPFLFQVLDRRYPTVSTTDRAIEHAFSSFVIEFARSREADPAGSGLPAWPRFDPNDFRLMDFNDRGAVFGPEPRRGVPLVEKVARCP